LVLEMPEIERRNIQLNSKDYQLIYRGNGRSYALTILNPEEKVVFTDGPRWVRLRNSPNPELTTSMSTTWTDPKYRGEGIYQFALKFYMEKLNVHRSVLYTENLETLEFIYRLKQLVYTDDLRHQLLEVPGIKEYLNSLGVPLEEFAEGKEKFLKQGEMALSYLSLQGRTRLNTGLSFNIDKHYHSIVRSSPLPEHFVELARNAMKVFETQLKSNLNGPLRTFIQSILPSSYLQKYGVEPIPIVYPSIKKFLNCEEILSEEPKAS
jgi:hypothetical protein